MLSLNLEIFWQKSQFTLNEKNRKSLKCQSKKGLRFPKIVQKVSQKAQKQVILKTLQETCESAQKIVVLKFLDFVFQQNLQFRV